MKIAVLTVVTAGLAVLCSAANISSEQNRRATLQPVRWTPDTLGSVALFAIGTMLIEQRKASWHEQRLLRPHEKKLRDQIAALDIIKELHEKDLISGWELKNRERAVADLRTFIARDRESFATDGPESARVEEKTRQKSKRPVRSKGKVSRARPALIRYDGAESWTIDDAEKIKFFFRERFGRELPISAFGQSPTHDRLGLNHSDALDVAVRPDSAEGRALMAYLRSAGIPFTAFRGRISRMSTGAHIHIGPPSPRLVIADRQIATEEAEGPS